MVDTMSGSRFSLRLGRESDESWNEERSRAEDVHHLRKIIVDVVNIGQDNRETRGSVHGVYVSSSIIYSSHDE